MVKNDNVLISVVIPTKNEEKYLEKTLKQYSDIKDKFRMEVIISDGGSTDNTLKIARKYADRLVVAKKGVKQNIAMGRNAGASVARGYIIFNTDADVLIPHAERFFNHIINLFKNNEVVAATTKLKIYPSEERLDDKIAHTLLNILIKTSNHFGSFLAKGECQIVRASSFKKVGKYNEKIVLGEDCDLFFRLAKIGRIKYLKNLVIYHSPRRFRKEGYLKIFVFYALRDGVYLLFTGKSYVKEWKPIR